MRFFSYLAYRWIPVILAVPLLGAWGYYFPSTVLAIFDFNSVWLGWVGSGLEWAGEKWVAPQVPPTIWPALAQMVNAIESAYDGFVAIVHFGASALPDPRGPRVEVVIRGYLAEGWVAIGELATFIRFIWA